MTLHIDDFWSALCTPLSGRRAGTSRDVGKRGAAHVARSVRRALPCRGRGLDGCGGLAVLATPTAPTARAAGSLGHSPAGPACSFAHRWRSSRSCEGRGRLRRARRAVCRRAGRARSEDRCADAQEDAEPPAAAVGARARPSLRSLQADSNAILPLPENDQPSYSRNKRYLRDSQNTNPSLPSRQADSNAILPVPKK